MSPLAALAHSGLIGALLIGCSSEPKPAKRAPVAPVKAKPAEKPLPAAPAAALPIAPMHGGEVPGQLGALTVADGYRPTPAEYNEPDWDHVRTYPAAHLAHVGRDLARAAAARHDWKACAKRYTDAAADVRGVTIANAEAAFVRDVLAKALDRDAAVCTSLASGSAPAVGPAGSLHAVRMRYVGLVLQVEAGADVRREARAFGDELAELSVSRPAPPASASSAEQARWLAEQWVDTVDPLVVTDPWGSWTVAERPRQLASIRTSVAAMASGETKGLFLRPAVSLAPVPPSWSFSEFGALPLQDAYVDVGGWAAPHVTLRLAVFGLEDPAWKSFVESRVGSWGRLREGELPRAVRAAVAKLRERPEDSRYYNVLALQNAAIRTLARQGNFLEAIEVLREQGPPEGLDWYSPDRAAVLLGLEGRLRVLSGDHQAEKKLLAAQAESRAFLSFISMREGLDAGARAEMGKGGGAP